MTDRLSAEQPTRYGLFDRDEPSMEDAVDLVMRALTPLCRLENRDGRMQTPDDEELRRARRNVMHLMDWYEALARATDFFIVAVQEHGGQSDEARAEFDRLCGLRLDQR